MVTTTERSAPTTRLVIGLLLFGWLAPPMIVGVTGLMGSLLLACAVGLWVVGTWLAPRRVTRSVAAASSPTFGA